MKNTKKKKMPSFEELFEKRRRLSNIRKRIIQARNRHRSHKITDTEKPTHHGGPSFVMKGANKNEPDDELEADVIKTVSNTCENASNRAINDNEEVGFDYNSDDSVKDKDYKPDEDDISTCSEISNSPDLVPKMPTKVSKDQVKRRIFSPEKVANTPNNNISVTIHKNATKAHVDAEDYSELITVEDLLSQKNSYHEKIGDISPDFDDSYDSPPRKRLCLESVVVVVDEIGHLSDGSDAPIPDKTHSVTLIPDNSKALVCYKTNEIVRSRQTKISNVTGNYSTIVADSNGVVYLSHDVSSNQICEAMSADESHSLVCVPDSTNSGNIQENESASNVQSGHETPGSHKVKKKIVDPTKWKRNASKIARMKGSPYVSTVAKKKPNVEGCVLKPPCSCKAKCYLRVPHDKREQIFNQFWKKCLDWEQRRQFIACTVKKETKRCMKTSGNFETDRRKFTYIYNLSVDRSSEKVCKLMFLNTLGIGEKFVKLSINKQLEGGLTERDQRGKHVPANKSPEPMIEMVMNHIKSYPSYESHYSRQKSEKKYIGPELNIATMYKHYKELMISEETPPNLIAKEWLYRNIFNTKFNLSFKLPSVDTCDECDFYERKLQDATNDTEREEIKKEKDLHSKAADERYALKRSDKEEAKNSAGKKKTVMFDLQKCLATPNLTNTKSFYLRKLWTLNLTIYDSTTNVASNMIWPENISGRGGNEVASCLIRWAVENGTNNANLEELTMWSDNCAGQNRNLMIITAYIWLLHRFPQLKIINHKFMLKGHTHMEVDRIHSIIEKKKKKLKTMQIAIPRDWSQFIRTCGGATAFEVFDMELQHFKDVTTLYKKPGPLVTRKKNKNGEDFKISECVWFQLRQEKPGVLFYKTDFTSEFSEISLVRNASKGIRFPGELPTLRQQEKPISTAKYNDLITLLQWVPVEFHAYYKNLKHSTNEPDFPDND